MEIKVWESSAKRWYLRPRDWMRTISSLMLIRTDFKTERLDPNTDI